VGSRQYTTEDDDTPRGMRRRGSPRRLPRDGALVVRRLYATSPRNLALRTFTDRTPGHCLRTSENSRYAKFVLHSPDEIESADGFMDACLPYAG
jgi:hypothetical protein